MFGINPLVIGLTDEERERAIAHGRELIEARAALIAKLLEDHGIREDPTTTAALALIVTWDMHALIGGVLAAAQALDKGNVWPWSTPSHKH